MDGSSSEEVPDSDTLELRDSDIDGRSFRRMSVREAKRLTDHKHCDGCRAALAKAKRYHRDVMVQQGSRLGGFDVVATIPKRIGGAN